MITVSFGSLKLQHCHKTKLINTDERIEQGNKLCTCVQNNVHIPANTCM